MRASIQGVVVLLTAAATLTAATLIPSNSAQHSTSFSSVEQQRYSAESHARDAASRIHEGRQLIAEQPQAAGDTALPAALVETATALDASMPTGSSLSQQDSNNGGSLEADTTDAGWLKQQPNAAKGKGVGSYETKFPKPTRVESSSRRGQQGEKLVFLDEFKELDTQKWQHEITAGGGGNWEFQYYTNNRSNSYVRDSVLYLKPTLTQDFMGGEKKLTDGGLFDLWGNTPADLCTGNAFYGCQRIAGASGNIVNPIQSARIRTAESFSFKYGRLEVSARLPVGDWLWPAIWLMPRYNQYGKWPSSGEIDLVESRGNTKYQGKDETIRGADTMGSTLHWGPNWQTNGWNTTTKTYTLPGGTLHDAFHVYGMKWTKEGIYTYIDDESNKVLDVKFDQSFWSRGGWDKSSFDNPWAGRSATAPFDQKFFLIMNLAVGGTNDYWPDGVASKPWVKKSEHAVNEFWKAKDSWMETWKGEDAALQVDWVKVWHLHCNEPKTIVTTLEVPSEAKRQADAANFGREFRTSTEDEEERPIEMKQQLNARGCQESIELTSAASGRMARDNASDAAQESQVAVHASIQSTAKALPGMANKGRQSCTQEALLRSSSPSHSSATHCTMQGTTQQPQTVFGTVVHQALYATLGRTQLCTRQGGFGPPSAQMRTQIRSGTALGVNHVRTPTGSEPSDVTAAMTFSSPQLCTAQQADSVERNEAEDSVNSQRLSAAPNFSPTATQVIRPCRGLALCCKRAAQLRCELQRQFN